MNTGPLSNLLPSLADFWTPRLASYALPACQVAELIVQGEALVPATPTAPGTWRPLDLDAAGGCCYVRRVGAVQLSRATSPTGVPANCGTAAKVTARVPVRVLLLLDAERLECRHLETGLVALERLLAAVDTTLALDGLGARGSLLLQRGDTDAARIFTAELGFPVALPAHRAVAALDLEVSLTLEPGCLPTCTPDP